MVILSAAFSRNEVIPAVFPVQMRAFRQPQRCPFIDRKHRTDQPFQLCRILLQNNSGEAVLVRPVIPQHIDQPFAPVQIMEQGRIKTAAVQINRL
ncbi:hypothetical protein D3C75_679630 [compost metagenome]